jgi:hypothetical protein
MTAVQVTIVIAGSLVLMWAMVAWMRRINENERRCMERRRQEWTANGRVPGQEPNFFSGTPGA